MQVCITQDKWSPWPRELHSSRLRSPAAAAQLFPSSLAEKSLRFAKSPENHTCTWYTLLALFWRGFVCSTGLGGNIRYPFCIIRHHCCCCYHEQVVNPQGTTDLGSSGPSRRGQLVIAYEAHPITRQGRQGFWCRLGPVLLPVWVRPNQYLVNREYDSDDTF